MGHNKVLKVDLVKKVAETTHLPRLTVETALNAALANIKAALASGEEVYLAGFGTFSAKPTAARTGRNPQTGEPVEILAGRRARFQPSKGFLEA